MSLSMKCLTGALALGLSACALGTAARVPSAWDPSHPEAAESPVWSPLALGDAPAPASPPPVAPPEASQASAEPEPPSRAPYACPMHEDVTAHEPGRCPKCGMRLVLQAGSASPGGGP